MVVEVGKHLDTYSLNDKWNPYSYDLSGFNTFNDVRFRFRLQNDGGIPGDGFYFDDFEIADYNDGILNSGESAFSEVKIYPNPSFDTISIQGIASLDLSLQLYDINGRELEFNESRSEQ